MDKTPAIPLVLAAAEPATAARWAEILQECGQPICREPADIFPFSQGAVVVTDRADWPGQNLEKAPAFTGLLPAETPLVRIGEGSPADVRLPCDFHPRELQTACRLLSWVVLLRQQLHARQETNSQLLQQVLTDPLTGLPNRRAWEDVVGARLAEPMPPGGAWCLAILDLDHFKAINDTFGHPAGDTALRVAGHALRDSLRQGDLVARLGGDEFGLLLPLPSPTVASTVVERVRAGVARRASAGGCPPVTASLGYCLSTATAGLSPDTLLSAADAALRRAKREGRNRSIEG